MTKQAIAALFFSFAFSLGVAAPARAGDIVQTLSLPSPGYYDSPNGYDFSSTFPPSGPTTIGTFTISIPAGDSVTGITISGNFGNPDGTTTALSDYYLGFSTDETAVEVASCDNISDNCYSGQEGPYTWTATLTQAEIAALAPALAAGSIDFTYTWGSSPPVQDFFSPTGYDDQYVYAGDPTIDVSLSPEPATILICLSGLAGLAALRRFRKI
jgi:hypothetical protein